MVRKEKEVLLYRKHRSHFEYKYLPQFVYGGIDGAITTFAVVAGVIGASLSSTIVLILGFANLFADGFSMATSNYFSTKSENDLDFEKKSDYANDKVRQYSLAQHRASRKKNKKVPLKTAFATFIAFILVGLIPLLSFVYGNEMSVRSQFLYSAILTGFAFFIVGFYKGFITKKNPLKSALETLIIGSIAAGLAFGVGYGLSLLV